MMTGLYGLKSVDVNRPTIQLWIHFFNKWKKTKFFHAIAYLNNFSYGFAMLDQ